MKGEVKPWCWKDTTYRPHSVSHERERERESEREREREAERQRDRAVGAADEADQFLVKQYHSSEDSLFVACACVVAVGEIDVRGHQT